jgi:hypothetical protein
MEHGRRACGLTPREPVVRGIDRQPQWTPDGAPFLRERSRSSRRVFELVSSAPTHWTSRRGRAAWGQLRRRLARRHVAAEALSLHPQGDGSSLAVGRPCVVA